VETVGSPHGPARIHSCQWSAVMAGIVVVVPLHLVAR
jgi:hypothetical protein